MIYYKNEKTLDISDCQFNDLDRLEEIIKSANTPQGINKILVSKEQMDWYKNLLDNPNDESLLIFKGYKLTEKES